MKQLLIIPLAILLTACSGTPKVHTVYKDKYIPIPIVPKPPEVQRPDYYANSLTEEQKNDIGELGKAYVISAQEAINYTKNLREVYDTYNELARNSENRLKALENIGAEVDRSLLEQANTEISSEMRSLSLDMERNNEELSRNIRKSLGEPEE